jgi:hypothetical protein
VNLMAHVRRGIVVVAAVATSVAVAVGTAGATDTGSGVPRDPVATESPSSATPPASTDPAVAPTTTIAPASTVTSTTEPPAAIAPSTTTPPTTTPPSIATPAAIVSPTTTAASTSAATGTDPPQEPTPYAAELTVLAASAPTAPRSPTATPGNTRVKLAWLAPSSNGGATVDRYVVRRATNKSGPWTKIAFSTTRGYTAKGLTNGTRYYFRIRAHNAAGWGPSSTVINAVPRKVPTAPRSPVATPGNGSVTLSWKLPSSNGGAKIDKFLVQRYYPGVGWKDIASPTTRGYTAKGLTNGTKHSFRIRAHNAAGWGPSSTVVNAVPRTVPTAPPVPVATPGNGSVNLVWQAPSSDGGATVDKYEVQQWNVVYAPWTTIGYPTTPNYPATGLTNGTSYYFHVRAHNAAGWGPYSIDVNAVPKAVPPTAPTNLQAFPTGKSGEVYLSWFPPIEATADRRSTPTSSSRPTVPDPGSTSPSRRSTTTRSRD